MGPSAPLDTAWTDGAIRRCPLLIYAGDSPAVGPSTSVLPPPCSPRPGVSSVPDHPLVGAPAADRVVAPSDGHVGYQRRYRWIHITTVRPPRSGQRACTGLDRWAPASTPRVLGTPDPGTAGADRHGDGPRVGGETGLGDSLWTPEPRLPLVPGRRSRSVRPPNSGCDSAVLTSPCHAVANLPIDRSHRIEGDRHVPSHRRRPPRAGPGPCGATGPGSGARRRSVPPRRRARPVSPRRCG